MKRIILTSLSAALAVGALVAFQGCSSSEETSTPTATKKPPVTPENPSEGK